MPILKPTIENLRFVNGLPNPADREDQLRINFIKNGEAHTGATSDTTSDGVFNRPVVSVQANAVTNHDNTKAQQVTIGELVDSVNELTGGSGADIGGRVLKNETDIANLTTRTSTTETQIGQDGTIQGQTKTGLYLEADLNKIELGVRQVLDVKNASVASNSIRDDNWFLKSQIIGNKRNYDPNGNFNDAEYPAASGMQAALELNQSGLSTANFDAAALAVRVLDLEDNSSVGAVTLLRSDVGQITEPGYDAGKSLLKRAFDLEATSVLHTAAIDSMDVAMDTPVTGLVARVGSLETLTTSHTADLTSVSDSLNTAVNDIGTWISGSGSLRLNIENLVAADAGIYDILGTGAWATETTTVQYRLDKREKELGVKATDTSSDDTIWGYANRYLKGSTAGSIVDHELRLISQQTTIDSLENGIQRLADITTPHSLLQTNSGVILKFNTAATGVVNIPDGLSIGTSVMVTNLGTGAVQFAMSGTDTLRGASLLADANGMMSATKITATIWQSSER